MQKLSLREIQLCELNILRRFDIFCKNHNLRYYLMGGTLLGAIRHKGFIPWDDDIDVCMPRPDYEVFVKTFCDDECPNLELRSKLQGYFDAPFAKLVDLTTKVNSKYNHSEKNLWIDVFPIDGLPEDPLRLSKHWKKSYFYWRVLPLSNARLGEGKTTFRKYGKYFLKPLIRLYGRRRLINKIESLAFQYPYDKCQYVGLAVWTVSPPMLKAEFEKSVEVEFEGLKFPAFSCWDSFLRNSYGDYMQIPPIENRVCHAMDAYLIK